MDSVVEVPQELAGRYTTTAQFLHWFTAVLMFTVLPRLGHGQHERQFSLSRAALYAA